MIEQESQTSEIQRWKDRITLSRKQRKEDSKIRKKLARWYMNKFYRDGQVGMDEKKIQKRQVPYLSMFARHLQANLYAQSPTFTCKSPWRRSGRVRGEVRVGCSG